MALVKLKVGREYQYLMKATDKREIKLPPFKVKHVVSTLSQVHGWGITQLNIPETWKITRGEDITVMVIDTGYTNHSDLKGALIQDRCKSFISSEKDIDDHNGHSCVSPDTLIHTSYNGIETIEQLYNSLPLPEKIDIDENGEEYAVKDVSHLNIYTYSLDNNGKTNINKILLLHKAVVNEECIKIKLEGNIEYLLTPWHQVPVVSSNSVTKKRADTISTDDSFILPSSDIGGSLCSTYLDVPVANYIECPNCSYRIKNIKQRKQKKYRCWKCGVYNKDWNIGTEHLPLNEELAYISGLIITDGNINLCNGYVISFTTTTKELIDRFSDIAEKYGFGRGTIVSTTPCYDLRFSCKRFVNFLLNLGILAKRKSYIQQLPQLISKSPKSVICAFLAGVIDGDGCISECNTRNRITSVSLVWIKQLCALFNSLGMSAYYNINKNMLFNDRKTQSTIVPYVYNVCFSFPIMDICKYITHPKKLLRCQKQPKHSIRKWCNIKQIEKIPYYGHFYDFTIENDHTYIANGHFVSNTHCIGIIAARDNDIGMVGVAPKCNVISVKVLGADGSGDYEGIRNALRYAIKIQPHVISMSLGAYEYDSELHKLVKKLYSMNIPIIAAAGNDGTDNAVNYPGKFPETICVTAFDKNGNPADFNSTGKEADFSAPGVDIYSTWLKNKYASLSGTSMATPFMAGVVALLLSKHLKQELQTGKNDCKTVDQIKEHLKKYCDDKGISGHDNIWGYGVVDPTRLIYENTNSSSTITIPTLNFKQKIINWLRRLFW